MRERITITPEGLALDTMEGEANSYVRHAPATIGHVSGQVKRARRLRIPESVIRDRLRKAITNPPTADPERVREITRLFL
jgi:hypothetical protein